MANKPGSAPEAVESVTERALREWSTRVWRRHLLEQGAKKEQAA